MIEITKWPVVILTNYRTGSTALGRIISDQHNVEYFIEPTQGEERLAAFIKSYNERVTDKFVLKIMIDQVELLDIYQTLLSSDCFKIRLTRDNELEQSISYYIASSTKVWGQGTETLDRPYSVDDDFTLMGISNYVIAQNNKKLRESRIKFDYEYEYESLDLSGNGRFYKTTQPTNIDSIRESMTRIRADKRPLSFNDLGHSNVGWVVVEAGNQAEADDEHARSGYSVDWMKRDFSIDPFNESSRIRFSVAETRPSTEVAFWKNPALDRETLLWPTDESRSEFESPVVNIALEKYSKNRPREYSIVRYVRSSLSKDQLTRTTEFQCREQSLLVDMWNKQQDDYWTRHQYNIANGILEKKEVVSFQDEKSDTCVMTDRPPGDNFSIDLFFKLATKVTVPADYLYLWSSFLQPDFSKDLPNDEHERELDIRRAIFKHINKDLIIIGVKDHLTHYHFNPWTEIKPTMAKYLESMFAYYPNKKFILLTSMENLASYIKSKNVSIVPWGSDITNHVDEYKELEPLTDKNFESEYTFVSLNRGPRAHRAMLVSLLYGLGISDNGLISCMFDYEHLVSHSGWVFNKAQAGIKDQIDKGVEVLRSTELKIKDDVTIYENNDNDNVSNFKNKLAGYYCNTFVEIITETSFTERAYLITEKTLNSVYGCNFPILLCGAGAVQSLRDMGLDVFDDIVDHSYDNIFNPIDRLYRALTDNKELLTNNTRTKQLWKDNKHRFLKNIEVVKTKMYDYYSQRAEEQFDKAYNGNL